MGQFWIHTQEEAQALNNGDVAIAFTEDPDETVAYVKTSDGSWYETGYEVDTHCPDLPALIVRHTTWEEPSG